MPVPRPAVNTPETQTPSLLKRHSSPVYLHWDIFKAQFKLLADAAGWFENHKSLQLVLCLTDDAAACLLLLSPGMSP